ncbi:hypothetical protein AB1A64_09505 [Ruegeria sp. ANG10]
MKGRIAVHYDPQARLRGEALDLLRQMLDEEFVFLKTTSVFLFNKSVP